ncbi:MAG: AT-rich DNA-binding protein [Armatimonadetes bacterium]|nr:AT-rich DNA-binding protein [Armatimonadota bacterium]
MPKENEVPLPALERLSTYIRCLMQLERDGVESISSQDMERFSGVSAAQFRKDLSYFGEFGKRGIGYNVRDLRERIAHLLRIDQEQNVLLIGAGNLGSALIAYPGWRSYRFKIAAVFDRDPSKIGTTIRRLTVRDFNDVVEVNQTVGARIGILAIPAWEAQEVAEKLMEAGVTGLINFAPLKIQAPPHVVVREVCFICELAILSHLVNTPGASEADAIAALAFPAPNGQA